MLSNPEQFGPQSSLASFFEHVFMVERQPKPTYAYQFRKLLKWLRRVLRRPARLSDLRAETWHMFQLTMQEMGVTARYARSMGTRWITLWKFAAEKDLAVKCTIKTGRRPGPEPLPLPMGEPGTVLHLFWERYLPEVLKPARASAENYWALFRQMRECFGRDLRLDEMSSTLIAKLTVFLQERGLKAITVKHRRGALLCLWRFAYSEGLGPVVPFIRPLKLEHDVPDCWSLDEFKRIVAATLLLDRPPIGGVPAYSFWHALVLTAYYSALRRSTLFRLRPCDFDLETGWLTVPGSMMKNKVGQKFRLGSDAVESLKLIWDPRRDRVFPASERRGNLRFLSDHFNWILEAAGVEKSPRKSCSQLHKIRRTAVTMTAANSGLAQAIALAGHSGQHVNARYIDPRYLPQNDATQWLPRPTAD